MAPRERPNRPLEQPVPVERPGTSADPDFPVLTYAHERGPGELTPLHSHPRPQLLYALSGVMEAVTARGAWLVPPGQAVWIPADVSHEVRYRTAVSMRSLYVHPDRVAGMGDTCLVVDVSPLLAALIARLSELHAGESGAPRGRAARLIAVLIDELRAMEAAPLHLPLPADSRIASIVAALRRDPGNARTLASWARTAGASERTLARLFVTETGLGFTAWRQRLRLHEALKRLGAGESITALALDLGYQSPSAFIAMFRRALGEPPARYFRRREP